MAGRKLGRKFQSHAVFNESGDRVLITQEEAAARGMTRFYDGSPCPSGHLAERYTKNAHVCIDCKRGVPENPVLADPDRQYAKKGNAVKRPARDLGRVKSLAREPAAEPVLGIVSAANARLYLTEQEMKGFVEEYARTRDFVAASQRLGLTAAEMEARIAGNKRLHGAVEDLEERLNVKHTPPPKEVVAAPEYHWTAEKRSIFLEFYVDTGDIAAAREHIAVSPSELKRELDRNADFKEALRAAEEPAAQHLRERATQMALAGNDKLLTALLKSKYPEFRDRVQMDLNQTVSISDSDLNTKLGRLLIKYSEKENAVDAEFVALPAPQ